MNKPKHLIRSKKLEALIERSGFTFDQLKKYYGSRMIAVDRTWCYVGREDEPDYNRMNLAINELYSEYPKVFYAYCNVQTPPSAYQSFYVSPTPFQNPLTLRPLTGFSLVMKPRTWSSSIFIPPAMNPAK